MSSETKGGEEMNASQLHQLMQESKPKSLYSWAYQTTLASFPIFEAIDLWPGIEAYVTWVESLPMTTPTGR